MTAEQHTPPVNPVLFYYPDGYRVLRSDLKGRDSAGESFLSAFITQAVHSEVYALCGNAEEFREFAAAVSESRRSLTVFAGVKMRQKSVPTKEPAEQVIKGIRRATRRHFSAEDKIRIVLEGLRVRRASPSFAAARGSSRTFIIASRRIFSRRGRSDWLAIPPGPRHRMRSRSCVVRCAR